MRRLTATAAVALHIISLSVEPGCRRREVIQPEKTEETADTLSSVLHMADAKSSVQLLRGFHSVEGNSWRWTAGKFAVLLRPPMGAPQRGATLDMRFTIPEAVIGKVGPMTLSA